MPHSGSSPTGRQSSSRAATRRPGWRLLRGVATYGAFYDEPDSGVGRYPGRGGVRGDGGRRRQARRQQHAHGRHRLRRRRQADHDRQEWERALRTRVAKDAGEDHPAPARTASWKTSRRARRPPSRSKSRATTRSSRRSRPRPPRTRTTSNLFADVSLSRRAPSTNGARLLVSTGPRRPRPGKRSRVSGPLLKRKASAREALNALFRQSRAAT